MGNITFWEGETLRDARRALASGDRADALAACERLEIGPESWELDANDEDECDSDQSSSGPDAPTIERVAGESISLIRAGLLERADERLALVERPRFLSVAACREAYAAAMADKRARTA